MDDSRLGVENGRVFSIWRFLNDDYLALNSTRIVQAAQAGNGAIFSSPIGFRRFLDAARPENQILDVLIHELNIIPYARAAAERR